MSSAKERQQTLAKIRQVDRGLASDANAARQRTLTALRAASRFMAADTPHPRSSGSRASGRAIRFPKAPPASYSRAGISYHRSATTNLDGTNRSTSHMAFTNCSDTRLASAHQSYIDRETASFFP